jgi:hypothetical protein
VRLERSKGAAYGGVIMRGNAYPAAWKSYNIYNKSVKKSGFSGRHFYNVYNRSVQKSTVHIQVPRNLCWWSNHVTWPRGKIHAFLGSDPRDREFCDVVSWLLTTNYPTTFKVYMPGIGGELMHPSLCSLS